LYFLLMGIPVLLEAAAVLATFVHPSRIKFTNDNIIDIHSFNLILSFKALDISVIELAYLESMHQLLKVG
ncbi:hypothetical protein P3491_27685, partial [Vibrio parahaemolyticus]|nr:hypothetical protein [Vibrio parahaemolyticus]